MQYNPALDGLRAYAVGLVVLAHLPPIAGLDFTQHVKTLAGGLRVGYLGVDIFFVLSGFLVTRILLEDKIEGRFSFVRFYAKRTLRIFPIFYLCVLFGALYFALPHREILANVLYVSNYFYSFDVTASPLRHTWSLSVEEQFYLLWPLVLFIVPTTRLRQVLAVAVPLIVCASLVIAAASVDGDDFGRFVTRGTMFRILSLGAGAILACSLSALRALPISVPIVTGMVGLTVHLGSLFVEGLARPVVGLAGMSLLSISIFCGAWVSHDRRLAISRWLLEPRPVVYLGRISYGIYLYHFIVLYVLDARGSDNLVGVTPAVWLQAVLLSILIPVISFHLIESPLLAIKNRLGRRAGAD